MNYKIMIFFMVLLIACIGSVSSDIYTPSIPAISHALNTPINLVQFSMAIFMLGMAVTQLFYGPISEGVGRKAPLATGLIIVLIGSLVCYFAPNIYVLILGRFIQGAGAGAGPLFRPIFRDMFKGDELAKFGSYAAIIVTIIVPAAPALGGYFQEYLGWRSSFLFIIAYAFVGLILVVFLFRETGHHHKKERLKPTFILKTYYEILSSRLFMGYTACTFIAYGAFFSWFVTGPVLLIHVVGVSPVDFGWMTLVGGGAAMLLSGFVNGRLVKKLGTHTMLQFGWAVMLFSGVLMLGGYFVFGINAYDIYIPMILFYFGVTFIWPNVYGAAFTPFGHIAGYAGAIYGFMQIAGAAVLAAVMAHLPDHNQVLLSIVFMVAPVLSWLIFRFIRK